jgi:hypothetical protein
MTYTTAKASISINQSGEAKRFTSTNVLAG